MQFKNITMRFVVILLIICGADVNLQANNGTSPLMGAASVSPELARLLLSKGADIHATVKEGDQEGVTAFTYCITGIPVL